LPLSRCATIVRRLAQPYPLLENLEFNADCPSLFPRKTADSWRWGRTFPSFLGRRRRIGESSIGEARVPVRLWGVFVDEERISILLYVRQAHLTRAEPTSCQFLGPSTSVPNPIFIHSPYYQCSLFSQKLLCKSNLGFQASSPL
jgi:hypothetical protein